MSRLELEAIVVASEFVLDRQPFTYVKGNGQYQFYTGKTNGLVTKGWARGVFTLSVDLGDGVSHTRTLTLT